MLLKPRESDEDKLLETSRAPEFVRIIKRFAFFFAVFFFLSHKLMDGALLCKASAIIAELPPCQNSLQKLSNETGVQRRTNGGCSWC